PLAVLRSYPSRFQVGLPVAKLTASTRYTQPEVARWAWMSRIWSLEAATRVSRSGGVTAGAGTRVYVSTGWIWPSIGRGNTGGTTAGVPAAALANHSAGSRVPASGGSPPWMSRAVAGTSTVHTTSRCMWKCDRIWQLPCPGQTRSMIVLAYAQA